jgi:hypothetical protein
VAVDPTPGQLSIAREQQHRHKIWFPLVLAAAEETPFRDDSFDRQSASTAPPFGPTPTDGYQRWPACFAPAANSSSWATAPC